MDFNDRMPHSTVIPGHDDAISATKSKCVDFPGFGSAQMPRKVTISIVEWL
jgi:GTP-binding protein EngB required for normal cell division